MRFATRVLRWFAACCLSLCVLFCGRVAFAQESAPLLNPSAASAEAEAPPAEALEHYNRGRELYKAGRYREAAAELEQASKVDPGSANLVYNLARVYELQGEIDAAIRRYQHYRSMLPAGEKEELARVNSTLQRLEGARVQVAQKPVETRFIAPPRRERGVADAAFWTTASAAAAALAAGGLVGLLALHEERETKSFTLGQDGSNSQREQLETRADRLALSSDLLMSAGATLGVTAILLYALREKPAGRDTHARVELGALPGGALLFVGGRL